MTSEKRAEKRAEKRGRRSPALGGRPLSVVVWLSEREMALIAGMAARECLAVSAWLGEAGVRAATQPVDAATPGPGLGMREVLAVHVGLVDLRRILRNVGGNLNDVARHANVTGTLAAETADVQGMVARVVGRVDAALIDLRAVLALARSPDGARRAVVAHPDRNGRWQR